MLSSTRAAVAAALVIIALTSFPAFGAERVAGSTLPSVDFSVTKEAPYVAGVPASIPPSMLADVLNAPAAPEAPAAAAAVSQGPAAPAASPSAGPFSTTPLQAPSVRRTLYVSFAALQVMDAVSTNKAISAGGIEANPAMAGIVKNRTAFMAVKVGTAAAAAFFSEKLAKNHPRKATVMMMVLNVAYAGIVAHNYRVASGR